MFRLGRKCLKGDDQTFQILRSHCVEILSPIHDVLYTFLQRKPQIYSSLRYRKFYLLPSKPLGKLSLKALHSPGKASPQSVRRAGLTSQECNCDALCPYCHSNVILHIMSLKRSEFFHDTYAKERKKKR